MKSENKRFRILKPSKCTFCPKGKGLFMYYVIKGLLIGLTPNPSIFSDFVFTLCSERYILAFPLR